MFSPLTFAAKVVAVEAEVDAPENERDGEQTENGPGHPGPERIAYSLQHDPPAKNARTDLPPLR